MILPAKSEAVMYSPFALRLLRVKALALRDYYLLKGSMPRLLALFYWPALNMLNFGFLNYYLSKQSTGVAIVAGVMLGATILWEIMLRIQFGFLQPFLEELWSHNLGNIFSTPLRPWEYMMSLMLLSFVRTGIAMAFCVVLAKIIFGYSIIGLGLPLIAFAFNLVLTGWWFGLLQVSLMLRFGPSAEWLSWMAAFIISPLVAIYYPVTILPEWLQHLSWILPPTYIFEGMRAIMNDHHVKFDYMLAAFGLNILYFATAAFVFFRTLQATRRSSGLLQIGGE